MNWFHMAESFIHKNLADKRKEIQAYIGSLERDLVKARRDLNLWRQLAIW